VTAETLLREGRLGEAIDVLGAELRSNPTDARRRTFLFELLCFSGQFDRAEKQLDVLAGAGRDAAMGALLYRSALHAERTRREMFRAGTLPLGNPPPVAGTLNGTPFASLRDADPRIGARLEVFAAGEYVWIPFEHVESIQLAPPKRLRDLLWAPAVVRTGPEFTGMELGEVLVPVVTPEAADDEDDAVRLGRVTQWIELADGAAAPIGQKLLLVDDAEFPFLEVRDLAVTPPDAGA
jgi:type VI secretion system protein ImpE